jgi:hypothetical protein
MDRLYRTTNPIMFDALVCRFSTIQPFHRAAKNRERDRASIKRLLCMGLRPADFIKHDPAPPHPLSLIQPGHKIQHLNLPPNQSLTT